MSSTFSQQFSARLREIEARAKAAGSNITQVCKKSGIARATYERWQQRPPQTVAKVDELMAEVERVERENQERAAAKLEQ